MNVLIVDDQISVLKGIESGVHFKELGVDNVFYASGLREAADIINHNTVDIVMSDIEMPNENGLELIKWVMDQYPETLCILLTSHAEFNYAQESIRLGCFDYLLQPAPYEQIEDCLRRALQELYERKKRSQIYRFGQMMKTNETELIEHAVTKLFSRIPEDVDDSLALLNAVGYPLFKTTPVRILIIHDEQYCAAEKPIHSENSIHTVLQECLKIAGITYPVTSLTHTTPEREFCVTLFSTKSGESPMVSSEQLHTFYEKLASRLHDDNIMCYVGNETPLQAVRTEYHNLRKILMDENIGQRPGLYFHTPQQEFTVTGMDLTECISRWRAMLDAGNLRMLESEINDVILNIENTSRSKYKSLCDLHQQITHVFFSYLYENKADVAALFNNGYSYTDYMDSYTNATSLRRAIRYMLDAVEKLEKRDVPQSDVEKARAYITDNITNPLTVSDVAKHVNLSAEYFTKLFKRETGQNIKEYIMQAKIAAAKDLLEHSNMSVSMIALELGYSNFSHFSQIFKKYESVSPSDYRTAMQTKNREPQ